MNRIKVLAILGSLSLLLVACGSAQPANGGVADADPAQMPGNGVQPLDSDLSWMMGQSREDAQGSVTVTVTPQSVDEVADTIEFDVAMDTHSVDLSMDLTSLSTLTTDTGITLKGMAWDGGLGGHHVEGTLLFPASVNGTSVLDGATQVTIAINNVDAAERTFSWQQ